MKRLISLTIASLALVLSAGAIANVLVYENNVSKKKFFKQIDKLQGGGKCKLSWKGEKSLGLRVNKGNRDCLFTTPVEGDSKEPDHTIQAVGKVLKKTDKKVRKNIYVGLASRANRKSGYEIRVFPKGRRFQLLKNGAVLAEGKNKAINALDKRNQLRLTTEGNTITAKANGKRLAKITDRAAEEVVGRKPALAFGSEARANKDGFGVIDRIKIFVPSP